VRDRQFTILVIDDVIAVLEIEAAVLGELGYNVIPSNSAREALAIIAGNAAIDMVLTDVVMIGEIDGWELAERARELRPNLKVVFTSGYMKPSAVADMVARGQSFLPKPWKADAVANFMRRALAS